MSKRKERRKPASEWCGAVRFFLMMSDLFMFFLMTGVTMKGSRILMGLVVFAFFLINGLAGWLMWKFELKEEFEEINREGEADD